MRRYVSVRGTASRETIDLFIGHTRSLPPELPRVYHVRDANRPKDAVYVGRRCYGWPETPWGNPYRIGPDGNRAAVIAAFERYAVERLAREPGWLAPLRGKALVCWCSPDACHGDVLARLANRPLLNAAPGAAPVGERHDGT